MIKDMEENRKKWLKDELTKSRAKIVIDVYIKMILSGNINLHQLAQMYRPDQVKPIATLRRLLKQKEVKDMINEKLSEALKLNGINEEFIIKKRIEVLEGAMKKEDYTNAIKVLDSFEDKLDVKIKESYMIRGEIDYSKFLPPEHKKLSENTDN